MAKDNGINRRDFLRTGAAALGGGLLYLSAGGQAEAGSEKLMQTLTSPTTFPSPKRLSDITHALAQRGLSGEFGRATVSAGVKLEDLMDVTGVSEEMRCAHAIEFIAERAPLRILPGERIVGSATYNEAVHHAIPIYNKGSVSHTTLGFDKALRVGYKGLRKEIEDRQTRGGLDDKGADVLNAMKLCLDAAGLWHGRHLKQLSELIAQSSGDEKAGYERVYANLRSVPENTPTTFAEAVQSLWFMYAFQRLCGNWSGIGRIDEMLGPYLKHDLASGKTTLDEAREDLAHFWVKGTEWIGGIEGRGSGDAQHYQNIVLAGVDAHGNEITNEVTYLVLDVVEELHISDYPIAVRLNSHTPDKLLKRIAEVQRHGGGIVAVYNEDVVIKSLCKFGYPLDEARRFANDGCWEAIVPGKTNFIYSPQDTLLMLQKALPLSGDTKGNPDYPDFDGLYAAFAKELQTAVDAHNAGADGYSVGGGPAPLVSLMIEGCIEKARGYYDRGPKYTVLAPHMGGIANTANSLLAIKKLVYDEKLLTLSEFLDILGSDWEGQENLRRMVLSRIEFYGNDSDEADAMVKRVFDDYTSMAAKVRERNGVLRPAGISTFGREIEWRAHRTATADGHRKGEILATNFSPSPGTDKIGPTAALKSYCKMDFSNLPNIGTVELKVLPASVKGEQGVRALVGLMKSFVKLGGCFMHIDVVDTAMLLDAQRHPEKYPNLSVRIAGWSARFATMDKNWQDMVIGRTQQAV